jgi:hypothetical protein
LAERHLNAPPRDLLGPRQTDFAAVQKNHTLSKLMSGLKRTVFQDDGLRAGNPISMMR